MHQIQEILAKIFYYLPHDSRDYVEPSSTLAGLARTIKSFTGLATDVLWHTQPDLLNLVKCLPSHAVEAVLSELRLSDLTLIITHLSVPRRLL